MDEILSHIESSVFTLRLNRGEKKNALTSAMYEALSARFEQANADPAIGAIVLLGVPGMFCAGNDIKDFVALAMAGGFNTPDLNTVPVFRFLSTLVRNQKPLVVGVDGAAIGIGTTVLFHADYALASPRSNFATPFTDLGLVPEAASSLIGPNLMGHRLAFEMLVMGQSFDAARAEKVGLINAVIPEEQLEAATQRAAQTIAAKPREAVAISRRLLRGDTTLIEARILEEAKLFGERLASAEAKAAFMAFLSRPKA
jgi:enoyl-CoA hydratase/carnithine racemase